MTTKGSRRNRGIISTTAQRTAEISAACHDELPQRDSSAADGADSIRPPTTSAAHATQVAIPVAAHPAAFQRPIHTKPYLEGHKPSSLNCVSFSRTDKNNHHRPYVHINAGQTLAILTTMSPRLWHRVAAPHRATIAAKARDERRLPASTSRARLSHEQRETSSPLGFARDNGPTGRTDGPSCLTLRSAPTHRRSPKPSAKTERLARRCACLSHYRAGDRRRETLAMLCSLLC